MGKWGKKVLVVKGKRLFEKLMNVVKERGEVLGIIKGGEDEDGWLVMNE